MERFLASKKACATHILTDRNPGPGTAQRTWVTPPRLENNGGNNRISKTVVFACACGEAGGCLEKEILIIHTLLGRQSSTLEGCREC